MRSTAVAAVAAGAFGIVLGAVIDRPWATWSYLLAAFLLPSALLAVVPSRRRDPWLAAAVAGMALWFGGAATAMYALSGASVAGIPAGLAVLLLAVTFAPLPFLAWAYARGFDRAGLGDADLDDLRRRFGSARDVR